MMIKSGITENKKIYCPLSERIRQKYPSVPLPSEDEPGNDLYFRALQRLELAEKLTPTDAFVLHDLVAIAPLNPQEKMGLHLGLTIRLQEEESAKLNELDEDTESLKPSLHGQV